MRCRRGLGGLWRIWEGYAFGQTPWAEDMAREGKKRAGDAFPLPPPGVLGLGMDPPPKDEHSRSGKRKRRSKSGEVDPGELTGSRETRGSLDMIGLDGYVAEALLTAQDSIRHDTIHKASVHNHRPYRRQTYL